VNGYLQLQQPLRFWLRSSPSQTAYIVDDCNEQTFISSERLMRQSYYAPTSVGRSIIKWRCLCPFVRPSVCLSVPRPNSRRERHRKPKIGRMEAHHRVTREPIYKSKWQVTMQADLCCHGSGHYNYCLIRISLFQSVVALISWIDERAGKRFCRTW